MTTFAADQRTRRRFESNSKRFIESAVKKEVLAFKQKPWLDGAHGPGFIGRYAGCGLCQTGVPCAQRIPAGIKMTG